MAFGGSEGLAPPPGDRPELDLWFAQILAEIEELFTGEFSTLTVTSVDGIDYSPGSDVDVDLLTVGVTGTPRIQWDETFSWFNFSHNVNAPTVRVTNQLTMSGDVEMGSASEFGWAGSPIMTFDDTAGAEVLGIGVGVTANGANGALSILSTATPTSGHLDVAIGDAPNQGALATTADEGFLLIPGGSGPPTGTPINAQVGWYPLYYDANNNDLYIYNGSWRSVSVA